MLSIERYNLILNLVDKKKNVSLQELVEKLQVSEATVRRDLIFLDKMGKLKRVHGGATCIIDEEEDLDYKKVINLNEKDIIAQKAIKFIKEGDIIFLDAGSTTQCLIKYLKNLKNIKVVTSGFSHIDELVSLGIETYILGGKIKKRTGAVVGLTATYVLDKYNFDVVILGANSCGEAGYSTPDPEEALVKQKAITRGKKILFLCDSSKINKQTFVKFANLGDGILITEK